MTILVIDNYDSFTYNIVQQVKEVYKEKVATVLNDRISFEEIKALNPKGIIISPGPGHPGKETDFGVCSEVIERREELGCPILGICLGHQGIAHILGGKVERAEEILHGKIRQIKKLKSVSSSVLLAGIPETFEAMRYHSLAVCNEKLPPELRVTAIDEVSNTIMAMEHSSYPLFGLQFHPESIGTPCGADIMRNFSELCH